MFLTSSQFGYALIMVAAIGSDKDRIRATESKDVTVVKSWSVRVFVIA